MKIFQDEIMISWKTEDSVDYVTTTNVRPMFLKYLFFNNTIICYLSIQFSLSQKSNKKVHNMICTVINEKFDGDIKKNKIINIFNCSFC